MTQKQKVYICYLRYRHTPFIITHYHTMILHCDYHDGVGGHWELEALGYLHGRGHGHYVAWVFDGVGIVGACRLQGGDCCFTAYLGTSDVDGQGLAGATYVDHLEEYTTGGSVGCGVVVELWQRVVVASHWYGWDVGRCDGHYAVAYILCEHTLCMIGW